MKKYVAFFLAFILTFCMVACDISDKSSSDGSDESVIFEDFDVSKAAAAPTNPYGFSEYQEY